MRDNVHGWCSNSPTFCGVCDPEKRDNEDWLVKGSWFATSDTLGSHDIVFGYDSFNDMRMSNNYQSGSNCVYWPTAYLTDRRRRGRPRPGAAPADPDRLRRRQLRLHLLGQCCNQSQGTNFRTNSVFVNDKWRLNNNWSFNVGVRYDKNDGEDASHNTVAKDSRISPRLGVSYDIKGDGDWVVNACYGHYVTAIAGSVADQGAGSPSPFGYFYEGPDINADCTTANPGACLNEHQVLAAGVRLAVRQRQELDRRPGRPRRRLRLRSPACPRSSATTSSPPTPQEHTIGFTKRLGSAAWSAWTTSTASTRTSTPPAST